MDYDDRSSLYEQVVKLLKTFIGDLEVSMEKSCIRLKPEYLASGCRIKPKLCKQINTGRILQQARSGRRTDLTDNRFREKHKGIISKKAIHSLEWMVGF